MVIVQLTERYNRTVMLVTVYLANYRQPQITRLVTALDITHKICLPRVFVQRKKLKLGVYIPSC